MRSIIKFISILPVLLLLSSCTNALYFYETEKISLTVEARPDSSQPIQGNLGIKQRIALITPPKSKENGAALSSISSFRFNVAPESEDFFNGFNPVLIRSAFITGKAASSLKGDKAAQAAKIVALSGTNIASYDESAQIIINGLKNRPNDLNTLKQISNKPWNSLSLQDSHDLVRITGLGSKNYTLKLHQAIRNQLAQ